MKPAGQISALCCGFAFEVIETLTGKLMSSFNEQDSIDLDNPILDYTPLRLSERAAKLGPLVSQGARSQPIRPSPVPLPALLSPKAIDKPARDPRDLDRRAPLLSVATAVAGVAAMTALLFVTMKPASRQSVAPTPSEITGSLSESKAPITSSQSQSANDEQSRQLLQGFLQWRQNANMTEASE
jgi:hypothetical protein